MIAFRLLFVVALAFTVNAGDDLKRVYELMDCFRKVATEGIPSADIPRYNPFSLTENAYWNGTVGPASLFLDVSYVEWYGLPFWHASIEQLSRDSDSVAVFDFHIFWDKFVLTSSFSLVVYEGLMPVHIDIGNLSVTLEENFWKGQLKFTKPGFNETVEIDGLNLLWTVDSVNFNFSGMAGSTEYAQTFNKLAKDYFDSGVVGNILGLLLQERVNTFWLGHQERIDAVSEFCKKN